MGLQYVSHMRSHSLNMHAQLSSGASSLNIGLSLHLSHYLQCASSEGSGETARLCSLARAFAARICDK